MTDLPQKRSLITPIPGPNSQALHARRTAAVASGVGSAIGVYAARAAGGVIVDIDGNSLIDLGSGIAVTSVGSAAPAVVAAVSAQAELFTHTCFTVTPYEGYVALAEKLNQLTPGDHEKRSALFNSGAEAVENAVKIARAHTKRQAIVVFDHAFHGRTSLTMGMTAKSMPYKHGFGPFPGEIYRVPMSYPFRDNGISGAEAAARAISMMDKQIGGAQIAAVVIEPIQGEGGFVAPAAGFLSAIAEYCTANGIVFIADEIQTGFCRTGDWFAVEHEGVVPDLVTTAKGIAGGLPVSGVTGRAEIMDSAVTGGLGGTYAGNPIACAAGLAAIEMMEELDLRSAARRIEAIAVPRLRAVAESTGRIGDIRGRGAMLAMEFTKPGTIEPDAATTAAVAAACHREGVVVLTCGTYGNVIRLLPPLVIGEDLFTEGLDVLQQAIESV